jgi:WD40 repeat protein
MKDDVIIVVDQDKTKSKPNVTEQDGISKSEPLNATKQAEQDGKNKSESRNPEKGDKVKPEVSTGQDGRKSESHNATEIKSKPHNGKTITKTEVSPKGNYLVTYSQDDRSIVGWNINDIDEGRLKPDRTVLTGNKRVDQICVSDDKKLVYIYSYVDIAMKFYLGK